MLTDGWDDERSWTLAVYEARGGYRALRKALGMTPDRVLTELRCSHPTALVR